MSAFENAKAVEARAITMLAPFLEDMGGRFVLTDKGRLARFLQQRCGDLLYNDKRDRIWGVEIKAEREHTGNLFLEVWSNRNLADPQSHGDRGSNPGWMFKTQADLLFYLFLDTEQLYVVNAFSLMRWAFVAQSKKRSEPAGRLRVERCVGRIWDFPERQQMKYDQLNDTHGRIVPIRTLVSEMEIKPRVFSVGQLRLNLLADANGERRTG